MKTIKERLKSKAVWVAILSQVLLIVTLVHPEVADSIKIIAGCVIEIATLVGILNNPSDSENF